MADEIVGQKMSDYTDIDESSLTAGEKAYYKEHAKVTTFGKTGDNDAVNSNYNVPLSEIAGSALPPYDQSTSSDEGKVLVVNDMEASWKQYPSSDNYNTPISGGIFASGEFKPVKLHYDNTLTLVTDAEHPQYNKNLSVAHPVPDPGTNVHRGDVLMVDNSSDDIVWAPAPGGGGYEPGTDSALVTSGSYVYVNKDDKTVTTNVNGELAINYGDGLHYDDISDKLVVDCYDSGGLAFESYSTGKSLKVKAGNGIDVGSSGVKISTDGANDGDVLTYNGTTHTVGWAAGGGGGYTVYNLTKTVADLTQIGVEDDDPIYALDINVVNHGIYFLDIHTIDSSVGMKKIRVHVPALSNGDYYDIVIQTQVAYPAPYHMWEVYCSNVSGNESRMTKIWYYDDYNDEYYEDTELHLFGRHATIMRLEGGAGE